MRLYAADLAGIFYLERLVFERFLFHFIFNKLSKCFLNGNLYIDYLTLKVFFPLSTNLDV